MNPLYFKASDHLKSYLSQEKKLLPFYAETLFPDWQKLTEKISKDFKQHEIVDELISQNLN